MTAKKQSILVVDDEPEIVNSLYDTFVDKYKMFKANSAKEALEIIEKNQIDLVISDHRMPETTGVELFAKMEKDHPHIGKVLLTGYSNIHAAVDAINKGHVDKYITKPWEEDDITHIVLEVMDTRLKKAIKDRKHADQELKKAFSLLKAALDSTHDGILVVDTNGKIANYNSKFQEMWGIPDSILKSGDDQKRLEFVLNQLKDPDSFITKVKDIYNHPESTSIDFIEFNDGKIFERYSQPQKIEDQVIGRVWSFHDITQREQAEDKLKKSEQKLKDALELTSCIKNIAPYCNIIMDSKGTILDANPASESIFGYKIEELIGKHIGILSPPGRQDEYTKYIERYLAYKKSDKPEHRRFIRGPEECTAVKKNGEEFPVLLFIRNTKAKGEDVFVVIVEEFTERKKREKKLKKAEEYVRSLIECSMDMIISVDQNRRIVEFNRAAEQTFGYKKEEVIGKEIKMLYASLEEAKAVPILLQGRKHFSSEILNKRKNGEIFQSVASVSIIEDTDGKSIGTVGISRDTTHQKNVQEDLRIAMKRARDANKAKDEFLSNMSHEIRTPLNGIIGMTELLVDTDVKDVQLNLIRTLNSEANSLLGIINNVLDFSKIEARKLELEDIDFDLNILMDDVTNSFAYRAIQKKLEFHSFLAPDLPTRLIGDPVRLRQILVNLIGNALKFTHKGEVFIKSELAEDFGNSLMIKFSVKDTGVGIPKNKLDYIFERFSQADSSTTRKYGGTGLGTTISKQLTNLMGGEICVKSEEGKGSTFYFTAKFTKQTEQKHTRPEEKFHLAGKKVLVVDDNETNRFILTEHLKSWECLPVGASGGKETLDLLDRSVASQKPFDLVITDYMMPEMDGFDLVKLIKKRELLKDLPIIILTSAGEIGDAQKCKSLGIQGYLTKPIRQDYLYKAIESVFAYSKENVDNSGRTLVTKHTVADKSREKDVRILLVEDYLTNQEVAIGHLRRAGYKVDLTENGQQAVEAHKKEFYDIIFMDIQMPVMDGYEATAKIRAYEEELKSVDPQLETHVVIIAMTAHALKRDRKKCLDGGMDDFISKPLRRRELMALLDKWVNKIAESRLSVSTEDVDTRSPQVAAVTENRQSPFVDSQSQKDVPINIEVAIDEFEGDKKYLMKVLEGFLQNVSKQIKTMRQAISDEDAEVVRKEAHSIKGGAANLTADKLSRIASDLEKIGKTGALAKGAETLEKLEKEFQCLEDYVKDK